jgi:hypothetical protein
MAQYSAKAAAKRVSPVHSAIASAQFEPELVS